MQTAHRDTIVIAAAAEAYASAEGRGHVNDLDLRAAASEVTTLFDAALSVGVVRPVRNFKLLIDAPHLFVFREDRLNRYVYHYARSSDEGDQRRATAANRRPTRSGA
jgi:hypothetical protein